jgi:hypothetical protein
VGAQVDRLQSTLFGGLLRCSKCGAAMIATAAYRYGCVARKDRGAAVRTGTKVPRRATDARLLALLREDLAGPAAIAQVRSYASRLLAEHGRGRDPSAARISSLRREIGNLVDAIAQVGISDALRARLSAAESELRALQRKPAVEPLPTVDDVVAAYRRFMLDLAKALDADVQRARSAITDLIGTVTVAETEDGIYAEMEARPDRVLLAATGAHLGLVAGAGFGTRLRTWIVRGRT